VSGYMRTGVIRVLGLYEYWVYMSTGLYETGLYGDWGDKLGDYLGIAEVGIGGAKREHNRNYLVKFNGVIRVIRVIRVIMVIRFTRVIRVKRASGVFLNTP
jgi:hypothetical protein